MTASGMERPFWSPSEVAEFLPNETGRSVTGWCRERKIPGAKKLPNGRWVIPSAWVKDLLSEQDSSAVWPEVSRSDPLPEAGSE